MRVNVVIRNVLICSASKEAREPHKRIFRHGWSCVTSKYLDAIVAKEINDVNI